MPTIDELKGMASSKLGFARTNNYLVELPSLSGGIGSSLFGGLPVSLPDPRSFIPSIPGLTPPSNPGSRELNVLCKNASLPSKQITTLDRQIGMVNEKIANGYAVSEVSLTFYMLNDYGVKNYFDTWRSLILNEDTNEVGYKKDYAKSVKIHQLRKPQIGRSAGLGPLSINVGIGGGSVYSVELLEAFPINTSAIDFSNDLDGLIEFNVSLSYTNWKTVSASQKFINVDIGF